MINYKLDISDCYNQMICLDNFIGLSSYFSILDIIDKKEKASILLNNFVVNMDEQSWYGAIVNNNNNSIVTKALNGIDVDELDVFRLMLQRAELIVSGIKCVYIQLATKTGDYYHSTGNEFRIGDKNIWLAGDCSDIENATVNMVLVFDGGVELSFNESDMVIESIGFNNFIKPDDVDKFNKAQDSFICLKNRRIEDFGFSNIKSGFLEFEKNVKYFEHSETGNTAIRNHKV
ncbi:hypothetical protein ACN5LY_004003 [Cronobacter dublinensis]|uniref:hypothetical protein n=1 Tax=Cronobacter dublinensis TaxID=413497 RepID=UPI0024AF19D1|nr:hypothetical protein [Cronobacter dublinensis]MDI7504143.1 hypothetical protein [Cronobacter dublinensis]